MNAAAPFDLAAEYRSYRAIWPTTPAIAALAHVRYWSPAAVEARYAAIEVGFWHAGAWHSMTKADGTRYASRAHAIAGHGRLLALPEAA